MNSRVMLHCFLVLWRGPGSKTRRAAFWNQKNSLHAKMLPLCRVENIIFKITLSSVQPRRCFKEHMSTSWLRIMFLVPIMEAAYMAPSAPNFFGLPVMPRSVSICLREVSCRMAGGQFTTLGHRGTRCDPPERSTAALLGVSVCYYQPPPVPRKPRKRMCIAVFFRFVTGEGEHR